MGARQIGINLEVQLRRALLHLAQHQVLDGIKPDRTHAQRVFDRDMEVRHLEALQQPQNLNIFPPPCLEHPRLHQSPQGLEVVRGASTYTVLGNWKLQAENGVDGYHVSTVHGVFAKTVANRQEKSRVEGMGKTESSKTEVEPKSDDK